jgi:hypothetical protein
MTAVEKKPVGRPRKYAGKRPTWTIRLEEKYGDQIKAIAENEGRSISEVCESRIVRSFRADQVMDLLEAELKKTQQELSDSTIAFRVIKQRNEDAEINIATLTDQLRDGAAQRDDLEKRQASLFQKIDELMELLHKPAVKSAVNLALGITPEIEALIERTIKRYSEVQVAIDAKGRQRTKKTAGG